MATGGELVALHGSGEPAGQTGELSWACVPSSLGTSSTVCVLCPQVKEQLIRETIELVDPVPFDREALLEVLRRRLGCKEAAGKEGARTAHDLMMLQLTLHLSESRRPLCPIVARSDRLTAAGRPVCAAPGTPPSALRRDAAEHGQF